MAHEGTQEKARLNAYRRSHLNGSKGISQGGGLTQDMLAHSSMNGHGENGHTQSEGIFFEDQLKSYSEIDIGEMKQLLDQGSITLKIFVGTSDQPNIISIKTAEELTNLFDSMRDPKKTESQKFSIFLFDNDGNGALYAVDPIPPNGRGEKLHFLAPIKRSDGESRLLQLEQFARRREQDEIAERLPLPPIPETIVSDVMPEELDIKDELYDLARNGVDEKYILAHTIKRQLVDAVRVWKEENRMSQSAQDFIQVIFLEKLTKIGTFLKEEVPMEDGVKDEEKLLLYLGLAYDQIRHALIDSRASNILEEYANFWGITAKVIYKVFPPNAASEMGIVENPQEILLQFLSTQDEELLLDTLAVAIDALMSERFVEISKRHLEPQEWDALQKKASGNLATLLKKMRDGKGILDHLTRKKSEHFNADAFWSQLSEIVTRAFLPSLYVEDDSTTSLEETPYLPAKKEVGDAIATFMKIIQHETSVLPPEKPDDESKYTVLLWLLTEDKKFEERDNLLYLDDAPSARQFSQEKRRLMSMYQERIQETYNLWRNSEVQRLLELPSSVMEEIEGLLQRFPLVQGLSENEKIQLIRQAVDVIQQRLYEKGSEGWQITQMVNALLDSKTS